MKKKKTLIYSDGARWNQYSIYVGAQKGVFRLLCRHRRKTFLRKCREKRERERMCCWGRRCFMRDAFYTLHRESTLHPWRRCIPYIHACFYYACCTGIFTIFHFSLATLLCALLYQTGPNLHRRRRYTPWERSEADNEHSRCIFFLSVPQSFLFHMLLFWYPAWQFSFAHKVYRHISNLKIKNL